MRKAGLTINSKILRTLVIFLPLLAMLTLSTPAMAAPLIALSPTSGAVGTKVTITGTNFESYRGDNIFIYFDNEEIASSPFVVPQTGSFSIDINIPPDATVGSHWIRVRNEAGSTLAKSLFTVTETRIKLDIVEGTVGTTLTITGTGFYADRLVTIYYYNRIGEKIGTEFASATGEFSYRFAIPNSVAGAHRIMAENAEGNSSEVKFEVLPQATLNLTSGAPGELLTVSGTGFSYSDDVSIYFGNDEVAYAKTDEYGDFEVTFNVPDMKPATFDVRAVDEEGNIDTAKFTITAGASLDQTTGSVGTELTVKGSGFTPGGTVRISYDTLQIATAAIDNNGAFSNTFSVPASKGGKHVITVSDDVNTRQLTFTVESSAPPLPILLLPVEGTETKPKAYFDWEDVADPSLPVTYTLQIASDQNFASIILEKEGLTESEYTLTEDESLAAVEQATPYHWRVKAIDSAANEGEWSTPWSCYIALPPVPALLLPEMDVKAPAQIHFDWEDVISPNPPVTYTLQIASDQNFTSIILGKKGLTESEYTLTEDENLAAVRKDAPYYWRVKVIDSAAIDSAWSESRPFHVGFSFTPPGWLIYTLIGLAVIIIGFLAFWMGRRTAYYEGE